MSENTAVPLIIVGAVVIAVGATALWGWPIGIIIGGAVLACIGMSSL